MNPVQYEIIKWLIKPHGNLFAVGDDDQSIYGFRGSDPSIMLRFQKDFTEGTIILLNKKVGLLSHPDETEYNDTLITRVKRYLYEKGEYNPEDENSFVPSLVNRIDRNTAGIVIAAKNPNPNEIKYEISDFLYHMMVLMAEKGITWEEIANELSQN